MIHRLSLPLLVLFLGLCSSQLTIDYDYSDQGNDWANYSVNCVNLTVRTVVNLSPIDFSPSVSQSFPYYYYFFPQYAASTASIKDYGVLLEVNTTEKEFGRVFTITAGRQIGVYQATSLRFHSEAEHTLNGTRPPVELQIYHQLIDSREPADKYQANLFVSVFFDSTPDNTTNDLLANITQAMANGDSNVTVDLSYLFDLTASRREVFSYAGTQTIPPCNPASWLVFPTVYHASEAQIQAIYDLYHNNPKFKGSGNYRAVQAQPGGINATFYMLNANQDTAEQFTFTDL